MIGYIEGIVLYSDGQKIIVSTQSGIGYEAFCSFHAKEGDKISFYTSLIIRENDHTLFSFKNIADKKTFELLLTVTGVGPKSSYALVSTLGTDGVREAILFGDEKTLSKAPGIGKKASSQIILSLKDKVQNLKGTDIAETKLIKNSEDNRIMIEALEALVGLGYKENHILPLIKKNASLDISTEALIKIVLKEL